MEHNYILLTSKGSENFMLSENEFQALFHNLSTENRQYITDLVNYFQTDASNFQRATVVPETVENSEHTA